jgi:hypothetical protein
MAVQEQTPYQEITANGVTTSFVLDFDCESKDHLIVTKDGVEPPIGDWSLTGGAVVFATAPANGVLVAIQRNTPLQRTTDYQSYNNSFRPTVVNKDFDWIWWKLQELWVQITLLWAALNSKVAAIWLVLNQEIQDRINGDLAIRAWVGILLNNIVDSGLVSAIAVTTVESVDDLQHLTKWEGRTVLTKSYLNGMGKGGSTYIYNASRSSENDGFLCINGWVLQVINNTVTPEQAGAICYANSTGMPDYTANHIDSADAIQKCLNSKYDVQLSSGVYNTYKPLYHFSNKVIKGHGMERSVICKRNNSIFDDPDILYQKDAVLIAKGKYVANVEFESFMVCKIWDSTWAENYLGFGIGYYAPYLQESSFKNFRTSGTEYGLYSINIWMTNWTKCSFSAFGGIVLGGLSDSELERGGTTNTFFSCWVKHVFNAGAYAWNIYSVGSTTISSGSTDAIGKAGSVTSELCAGGVFNINRSAITISKYGCEAAHMTGYLKVTNGAVVTMSGISCYELFNKYGGSTKYLFEVTNDSRLDFFDTRLIMSYNYGEQGLPTPNFMFVAYRSSVYIQGVMMYPRMPSSVNTTTGFDITVVDNSHVVVENDNSRFEYSTGQPNNTALTVPAINTTNRGVQSTSTTQDFGLIGADAGLWNKSRLRLGTGYIHRANNGQLFFNPSSAPSGEWAGYPLNTVMYGTAILQPIDGQLFFNTTTKKLRMLVSGVWYEVQMTQATS